MSMEYDEPDIICISSDEEEEESCGDNWTNLDELVVGGGGTSGNLLRAGGGHFCSSNGSCRCFATGKVEGFGNSQPDSDDDCAILEVKPDDQGRPAVIRDAGDDVIIVWEKGEFACRDYPHPRHLCAKYPFNITPHFCYCNMCYCYICDSPAPCMYWYHDPWEANHCHATDEDEGRRAERMFASRRLSEFQFRSVFHVSREPEPYQHSKLARFHKHSLSALLTTTLTPPPPEIPAEVLPSLKPVLHIPGINDLKKRKCGDLTATLALRRRFGKCCTRGKNVDLSPLKKSGRLEMRRRLGKFCIRGTNADLSPLKKSSKLEMRRRLGKVCTRGTNPDLAPLKKNPAQ